MKQKRWFSEARFGAFIHWGLYALPGGGWKGETMEYIGEWLQARFRIPNAEYAALAEQFNPTAFDAEEIVRRFRDAGIRYVVFTAKHHDGFAMYHSRVSRFNIVDATPFRRDPLAELAAACRKFGLRLGIYYSHCLDWHEKDGGDPGPDAPKNKGMSWGNDWDFPDRKAKDFDTYFREKAIPQLTELLSRYGEISLLWLDCPITIRPKHALEIRTLVDKLQPECLINSRIGCGMQDFDSLGDNLFPVDGGETPVESAATLNDTWGYKSGDQNWKPFAEIRDTLIDLASRNTNLLLNFGPDGCGRIPAPALEVLDRLAVWMKSASGAIHGAAGNPLPQELSWCRCTFSGGNRLNLFLIRERPRYLLRGISGEVTACSVPFEQEGEVLELHPPEAVVLERIPVTVEFRPLFARELFPIDGELTLLPNRATIDTGTVSGEPAKGTGAEELGAAAEKLPLSGHCRRENSGAISSWHNPADAISWDVSFPDGGRYRLSLVTRTRSHGGSWHGDREVIVEFNGRTVRTMLRNDSMTADGCYPEAESILGELETAPGETGRVVLRTGRILSGDALQMELVRLKLTAVEEAVTPADEL